MKKRPHLPSVRIKRYSTALAAMYRVMSSHLLQKLKTAPKKMRPNYWPNNIISICHKCSLLKHQKKVLKKKVIIFLSAKQLHYGVIANYSKILLLNHIFKNGDLARIILPILPWATFPADMYQLTI